MQVEPKKDIQSRAYIDSMDKYEEMYSRSVDDPESFWAEMADHIHWFESWDKVMDCDFSVPKSEWFLNGKTNACYNCLDRHVESGKGDKVALIWEGNDPSESKKYTYSELLGEVKRFANVLKRHGFRKGDVIAMYTGMVPELPVAMLACARLGIIHSVVFGGFSSESFKGRVENARAKGVIVSDGSPHGSKQVELKKSSDKAIEGFDFVEKCFVIRRTGADVDMRDGRDLWWHEEVGSVDPDCDCVPMDSNEPLFILYTSGSTGKPKGVVHMNGGYMVYAALTHKFVFDYHDEDVFWCTADIGWITGHTYIVYGPLSNGATSVMFEGVPNHPDWGRYWDVVDKYGVTQFYTAPTAIRACMKQGDDWVAKHDLSSLKILGSVGEPINPEAWEWYYKVVGRETCPVVDTWWQTETGGIMITPLPGATVLKPGSATFPFFGVKPVILDDSGREVEGTDPGNLAIKSCWPGMLAMVYKNPGRYKETYFERFPGFYETGDGAHRDEDGYFWIIGRIDDVIKVSGHRLGTAELESAFVAHDAVAEAGVVGIPHDVKGQTLYAYVILNKGFEGSDGLRKELVGHVRAEIGPIASVEFIQFVDDLPKTRSGKIMRRILRKVAVGESDFGDTSTLADPSVIDRLVEGRVNK